MFHCHNLIHEDHDMMAAFNVTALSDLGYNDTSFIDPMEQKWRAKPCQVADFQAHTGPFSEQAIISTVQAMANMQPYKRIDGATAKAASTKREVLSANEGTGPIPRFRRFVV